MWSLSSSIAEAAQHCLAFLNIAHPNIVSEKSAASCLRKAGADRSIEVVVLGGRAWPWLLRLLMLLHRLHRLLHELQ